MNSGVLPHSAVGFVLKIQLYGGDYVTLHTDVRYTHLSFHVLVMDSRVHTFLF